ncbi:MAG: hypothetical protein IH843_06240 [Thaumarchaeota archaeon]|nr:hypothetical protein [Nitrososphaerota archaeon]
MGILKVVSKVLGSSIFRNIKSKTGGVGKINFSAITGDSIIDIIKYGVMVGLIIYALKTGDWASAEKAKDFID